MKQLGQQGGDTPSVEYRVMEHHHELKFFIRAPENVKASLAASVPYPQRLGRPDEYAQVALTMITCGYFNGEDVRLDGAIRMAPR